MWTRGIGGLGPSMGQEMLVLTVVISNCETGSRAYSCTFYKHMGVFFLKQEVLQWYNAVAKNSSYFFIRKLSY